MQNGIVIKAECTIFKNNMQINCKKKSKLFSLSLDQKLELLVIIGKGENQTFKFPIQRLKSIHKKFIEQGKITLQFESPSENRKSQGPQSESCQIQGEGSSQIFINNACKQNLETLISQMLSIKKKTLQNKEKKQVEISSKPLIQKGSMGERKRPSEDVRPQQYEPKIGRKNLFNLSKIYENIKVGKQRPKNPIMPTIKKAETNLSILPKMLIRQILEYSRIELSQRLISKQFNELVLKNITNLKLREQIDELPFNKIAKWAINLQGRFKNVKTMKLQDRFDDQILVRNKAKSLYFGTWKEITHKNITQLKGLRIFCLEVPYTIKFQFSHFFGLRLVELRLVGRGINVRNSQIKDEDVLYMINNIQELKVIEIAYASSKLLTQIKNASKMQEIRIGTLNRLGSNQNWTNFKKFENLKILSIEDTQKAGVADDHQVLIQEVTFPESLKILQIGFNLSLASKSLIPLHLKHLKLEGAHFKNKDIDEFYLPELQSLDICECPYLTPECLQNMANIKVNTNWNRTQVDYASKFYSAANISISSVRGFSYC